MKLLFTYYEPPTTQPCWTGYRAGKRSSCPPNWPLEVVNALLIARRRGRVTAGQISEFIEDLAALPIRIEPASGLAQWPTILALAERHRLTAYDAAYMETRANRPECRSPLSTAICGKRRGPRA